MENRDLWAPWRISYVKSVAGEAEPPRNEIDCFLCDAADNALSDRELRDRLVVHRDQRGLVLLNRYPYTNGHLLVAPAEHAGDISELSAETRSGLMELVSLANDALKDALNPQGMNVGLNIGRCAGAGLPGHLHFHVVPRWHGDVNFMDVIGGVRVIPQALAETYELLREAVQRGAGP